MKQDKNTKKRKMKPKIKYDKEVDAAYVKINAGKPDRTIPLECEDGVMINLDVAEDIAGEIMEFKGIEILGVKKIIK